MLLFRLIFCSSPEEEEESEEEAEGRRTVSETGEFVKMAEFKGNGG